MKTNTGSVLCNRLIHVICLPFNITTTDDRHQICLEDIAEALESTPWTEGTSPEADSACDWNQFREYQARAYFHPFVRRFLYNTQRVRRYHRSDIKHIEVKLDHWLTKEFSLKLKVLRLELVVFQPDIGVLLLEVSPTDSLTLQQTQLLLDSFRRLYPPYVDYFESNDQPTWISGHCPVEVRLLGEGDEEAGELGCYRGNSPDFMGPYTNALLKANGSAAPAPRPQYPWAGHWRTLLQPFVCSGETSGKLRAQQLGDDRAPTFSWMALDDPRDLDRGDWMRLCFADPPGEDPLPYAARFMGDFETHYCYDRFWYEAGDSTDSPSRILNCGYAFCIVGSGKDRTFFANENNGAHAIFRHIHVEMGLIAHFQKAALLSASHRLSELVTRAGKQIRLPNQSEVREFYDHFVEFTQNFWFDEITPQQQGQELFQMWRDNLRIQSLYDEVHRELKDLVDYTELRATDTLNRRLSFVAFAGFLIAFFSLLAGIFGMNKLDDFTSLTWVGLVIAGLLLVALPFYALRKGIFKRNPS